MKQLRKLMFNTVIFDWKRTLYDPDQKTLILGAQELLGFIKSENIPMVLIGKGGEEMKQEVERLRVGVFFSQIVFAEGEKDPQVFKKFIRKDSKSILVIGDRVRSELEIGKKLGATTIWVRQGKFATELPESKDQEPDYTVVSLADCLEVIFNNPKIG